MMSLLFLVYFLKNNPGIVGLLPDLPLSNKKKITNNDKK